MPTRARIFNILLATALLAGAVFVSFQSLHSDPAELLVDLVLGLPVLLLIAGFALHATGRAVRKRTLTLRKAVLTYAGMLLAAGAVWQVTTLALVPSGIRYRFSSPGHTDTYQKVQFYFKHDGRWLEGPSAEGWPLLVRFPDLNGDGYPDIRVIEESDHSTLDFVYVPQNDGHSFWRIIKNDTALTVQDPPGGLVSRPD